MDIEPQENRAQRVRREQTESLPWVEKYRPKQMDELVSHDEIIGTITRLIDAGKLPHLLLYGPPGTGKTSTILACAHKLYTKNFASMVLELNASDDRGIDVVREQIKVGLLAMRVQRALSRPHSPLPHSRSASWLQPQPLTCCAHAAWCSDASRLSLTAALSPAAHRNS